MKENNNRKANMAILGLSEVDITPSSQVQTIGFGREDELSRGVLHGLSVQVAVWQFGVVKCCIVTIDNIGLATQHANLLRSDIGEILSISKDEVMLCFSHTHSAPNDSIETEYFRFLCMQIKTGVQQAIENMQPVRMAWGNTYADIGVNRRAGCDAIDRRIGILKVIDADSGSLRLLLLRLTAHANVLKEDNYLISPDYFGAVRELLSEKYGCGVMLTQGASGNISPKYFTSSRVETSDNPVPSFYGDCASASALCDMAEEVFRQVDKVIADIHPCNVEHLKMYSIYQKLDADVPSYDRALEIVAEAKKEANIDGTAWLAEVQRLLKDDIKKQTENVELQYFVINDGCLCGVPNEIMCEFALRANEQLQSDMFYFGGYTNGCTGYFPTEEEYDEGGYEVYWSMLIYYIYHGHVASLNRNSATTLIEAAVKNAPPYLLHCIK
jgi:hypothetical protein